MVKLWLASCHCLGPKNIHTLPAPQLGGSIDVLSGREVLEFPEGEGEHLPRTYQWREYGYFLEKYNLMSSFKIQIV